MAHAPKELSAESARSTGARVGPVKRQNNAPLALILEPSKELAEQTLAQIQAFKKHLNTPNVKELLIVGGVPIKDQLASLENGADIIVATPGRLVSNWSSFGSLA